MATSPNTVDQVRNLLRKLDRSIDDARSRRLGERPETPAASRSSSAQTDDPAQQTYNQYIGRDERGANQRPDEQAPPTPPQDAGERPLRARRLVRPAERPFL